MTPPIDPASSSYVGNELELFAAATNWKAYFQSQLRPFIRGDVLEVGTGLGGTTRALCTGDKASWTCLEPDPSLANQLGASLLERPVRPQPTVVVGTTGSLPPEPAYDAVLYIDVLEHIEDDAGELVRAARLVRPGGHICCLSPAHQWLFTPFDEAIGHYRRYTRAGFAAIGPPGMQLVRLRYLDAAGLLASLGNRLFLKASMPTVGQIGLWGTSRLYFVPGAGNKNRPKSLLLPNPSNPAMSANNRASAVASHLGVGICLAAGAGCAGC